MEQGILWIGMHRQGVVCDIHLLGRVMDLCVLVLSGRSNCWTFALANVLVGYSGYGVEFEHISSQSTRSIKRGEFVSTELEASQLKMHTSIIQ